MADVTTSWKLLLVIAGGHVAVWQSPTRRFFASTCTDPGAQPAVVLVEQIYEHGWSKLTEAILAAAGYEAELRPDKSRKKVLWETQPTSSYIAAESRVQSAVNQVITSLRGAR